MDRIRPILCAGSALWDIVARTDLAMKPGYDVPGRIARQPGGVALNVALALAARQVPVTLLSAVGEDAEGEALMALAEDAGVDTAHTLRTRAPTDSYLAIEAKGDVFGAVADCLSLEAHAEAALAPLIDGRLGSAGRPWPGALVLDGNFPKAVLDRIPQDPAFAEATLALVPASPGKAGRMGGAMRAPKATLYVNRAEARLLLGDSAIAAPESAPALVAAGAAAAVVTDGPRGATYADATRSITKPAPEVDVQVSTGAGDAFLAAHLDARRSGADPEAALDAALAGAAAHVAGQGSR